MNQDQLGTIEAYDKSATQFTATIATLTNYNETYNFLLDQLGNDDTVLDLACGPANISRYLCDRKSLSITGFDLSDAMLAIARSSIPGGTFRNQSIIDFTVDTSFDAVINGFGIPYLDESQTEKSLRSAVNALKDNGILYLSFMSGEGSHIETPSFNHEVTLHVYYHTESQIRALLESLNMNILKTWHLDYLEEDGNITTDIVIIARMTPANQ